MAGGIAPDKFPDPKVDLPITPSSEQVAVIAGGCFWCTEAVYRQLEGVLDVVSGYAGGTEDTADYRNVCSGETDHAEAIAIKYDPGRISYGQILKIFFSVAHDPTQLNRQGNDQGRQYRSAIFYANDEEKKVAKAYVDQLTAAKAHDRPIVTTLEPLEKFFLGEAYHQDYARRNPFQPYIAAVSMPKVEKVRRYYANKLKKGA